MTRAEREAMRELVRKQIQDANSNVITGDEVKFHADPREKAMWLPQNLTYPEAIRALKAKEREANQNTEFSRTYKFRMDDGLHAAALAMRDMFGMTVGKTIRTFFGDRPPEIRTIKIGFNKTMQVPCGFISVPHLEEAQICLTGTRDRRWGVIFQTSFEGPYKYKKTVEDYFDLIEKYLQINSIYRGKAVVGADELEFMDVSKFDPKKVVFADDVNSTLEAALFGPMRHTTAFELDGITLKRSILLYGPYGTGKTSIGQWTAQVAEDNGWTFFLAKTGVDKVKDVLQTARLYEPAVVFIEDVDTQAGTNDPNSVAELLDAFDGITAKDSKLIMVLTTNHVSKVHKGMLRPGRLDFVTEIGALDRPGVEKLIRVIVGDRLAPQVDFDPVFAEMDGFEPAFVRATGDRAKTFALVRENGANGTYTINTQDLVLAAQSLQPQLKLLQEANEGAPPATLDSVMKELQIDALESVNGMFGGSDTEVSSYMSHMQRKDSDDRSDREDVH